MADVLIAGGGIGGLATAIALRQTGISVQVYEQSSALREVGAGVSLWPNAMRALRVLGLSRSVLGERRPIERIVLRRSDGTLLTQLSGPGRYREPAICIHRADLQGILAAALEDDVIQLDRRLVDFEMEEGGITARFQNRSVAVGRLLIGCDGIHSVVRARLHGDAPPRYRGYEIWRGVSGFELARDLLGTSTEWWATGRRFGILPGEPGRVYWYATHTTGRQRAEPGLGRSRLRSLFADFCYPVPELIEAAAPDDVVRTDAEDRPVLRKWGSDGLTLLGDAAHPMTPNMGQGSCTAIEDALVLAVCIAEDGVTPQALRRYESIRAPRTRWILRHSRYIGWLGQLTNPLIAAVRDRLMRVVPEDLLLPPQRRVYGYRFAPLGPRRPIE